MPRSSASRAEVHQRRRRGQPQLERRDQRHAAGEQARLRSQPGAALRGRRAEVRLGAMVVEAFLMARRSTCRVTGHLPAPAL